jgi:hypothetical protein
MVSQAVTKLLQYQGGRHCIYLRSDLVNDSMFPFRADEQVVVRIDDGRLVIEPASPVKPQKKK